MKNDDVIEFQPMFKDLTEKLEDIAPILRDLFLATTKEAVEVCIASYETDVRYNDNYTFSTQLWRNLWNRYHEVALQPETPISNSGKGNDFAFKILDIIFKHHRIDRQGSIPKGAKAAKACADRIHYQTNFYWPELEDLGDQTNIILAIDADPENGLRDIFIGKLVRETGRVKSYFWSNVVYIYRSDEDQQEIKLHEAVHAEPEAEPVLTLTKDAIKRKEDQN